MKPEEPESLVMQAGVHTIRIDLFEDFQNKKQCRITCIDDMSCTEDEDGEYIYEEEDGCFYTTIKSIDKIIDKLNEAKIYLNNETRTQTIPD